MIPAIISLGLCPFPRNYNKIIPWFAGLSTILDCHNNLTNTGSFLTFNGCVWLLTLIILSTNYIGAFFMYTFEFDGL